MDSITGAEVAVALPVPLPPEQMWERITEVGRIGEWSPEATGARWCDTGGQPAVGARFIAHNRFPNGLETTVTCEVVESTPAASFAWNVLDPEGLVGSTWRYELRPGSSPGTTVVHQTFTHGPGFSGARADPDTFHDRMATICRNMATTIAAMAAAP